MYFESEIWDSGSSSMIFSSENEQETYDVLSLLVEKSTDVDLDKLVLMVYSNESDDYEPDTFVGVDGLDQWLSKTEATLGL